MFFHYENYYVLGYYTMSFGACAPPFRRCMTLLDKSNNAVSGEKCVQLLGDQAVSQTILDAKQNG